MSSFVSAFQYAFASGLLINELGHALVALPAVFILWKKTHSVKHSLLPFFVAYILDIDHLIDYWGYYGFGFDPLKFVMLNYFKGPGRGLVIFHAWEWVIILAYISYKRGWKSFITAFTLGLLMHIIWDSITVGSVLFYSIIYKYHTGFKLFFLI